MNKIELGKEYRTRDGREVKGLFSDGNYVYGYMKYDEGYWSPRTWSMNGKYSADDSLKTSFDLIEIKPMRNILLHIWDDGSRSHAIVSDLEHELRADSSYGKLIAIFHAETDGKVFNVINVEK